MLAPDLLGPRSLLEINVANEGVLVRQQDQRIGAAGLALESAAFVVYCFAFILARSGLGKISLPLPHHFVQALLMFLAVGFVIACLGILLDSKRQLSGIALVLFLPALMVIGVLEGHF